MSQIYSDEYQHFIKMLKQARAETGLTQTQVAIMLGKPQSYVAKIESGERRVDVAEFAEISLLYMKPLEYFLMPNSYFRIDMVDEQ